MDAGTCHLHPGREAAAVCAGCDRPVCDECVAPGTDPPRCLDCAIAEEGERAAETAPPRPQPEAGAHARGSLSPATVAVLAVGLVVLAAELAILLLMRPSPRPPEPAAMPPERIATAQSVADVIVVREAVESYKREHGSYPASLEDVTDSLPPELRQALRRRAVVYEVGEGKGYRIRYSSAGAPLLVLERDRNVIVIEEVTP